MRVPASWLLVACLTAAVVSPQDAGAAQINVCRRASVECRAGDEFLEALYRLDLVNTTREPAITPVLSAPGIVTAAEVPRRGPLLSRTGDEIAATVPPGWRGRVLIETRQPVVAASDGRRRSARVPVPPAAARTVRLQVDHDQAELDVAPASVVEPVQGAAGVSVFSILPVSEGPLVLTWGPRPPRTPAYSLSQSHRVTESVPGFVDRLELLFVAGDPPPDHLWAALPTGASVTAVDAGAAAWALRDGRLEVDASGLSPGGSLSVVCRLEGTATRTSQGAYLLEVPLVGQTGAGRIDGTVSVTGGRNELSFAVLEGAQQRTAQVGRLACEFRGGSPRAVVRVVPVPVPRSAEVHSRYEVSAHRVRGIHAIEVRDPGEGLATLVVRLPEGHAVRRVQGAGVRDWSQDGARLRVELSPGTGSGLRGIAFTTEALLGASDVVTVTPPVPEDMSSVECYAGFTPAAGVQLRTGGGAEPWRVPPESLPERYALTSAAIGYHSRDTFPAARLEVVRLEAAVRAAIQDHVTLYEEQTYREVLFVLDVQRRAVEGVEVAVPSGFTVERAEGTSVEGWDAGGAPGRVRVRFSEPLLGEGHFRLLARRTEAAGQITLRGFSLPEALEVRTWVGVTADVSVAVRPMEDGRVDVASVRVDSGPEYLRALDVRLLYECYGTEWELGLLKEVISPAFSVAALNVLSFRASGVTGTAYLNLDVREGGVGEVELRLPRGAGTPNVAADQVVGVEWAGNVGRVRFRGKRTGAFACRVDYSVVARTGEQQIEAEPVSVASAGEQHGVLLLTQGRPDVEVKVGEVPRALAPTEIRSDYADWGVRRQAPGLAAFTFRGTEWRLPLTVKPTSLSETTLRATVPLAKLDTLVLRDTECVNHLRLFISNTARQFLAMDMSTLPEGSRLVGTYVYGEPMKPFRREGGVLQLPLFTSDRAVRAGMSVLDVIYTTPHAGIAPTRRPSLTLPGLDLNVGQIEWNLRLPEDCRLLRVGGNMDKPVMRPREMPCLAVLLLAPVLRFVADNVAVLVLLVTLVACAGLLVVAWKLEARRGPRPRARPRSRLLVGMGMLTLLATIVFVTALTGLGGTTSNTMSMVATTIDSDGAWRAAAGASIAAVHAYAPEPATPPAQAFGRQAIEAKELAKAVDLEGRMQEEARSGRPAAADQKRRVAQVLAEVYRDAPGEADLSSVEDEELRRSILAGAPPEAPPREEVAGGLAMDARQDALEGDKSKLSRDRYNLGQEYMRRGEYSEAEQQFELALELDADNVDAGRQVARARAMRTVVRQRAARPAERVAGKAGELAAVEAGLQQAESELRSAVEEPRKPAGGKAETGTVAMGVPLRKGRASIVQRLAGGRSVGALPIALDFPTPPTVSYGFVRPFLGRAQAELRVRPISRGTAMLAELALAVAAAALLAAARTRSRTTALAAEGGVLAVSVAVLAAVPAPGGALLGATALVAAAFLGAEAISTTARRMRRLWAQESPA